MKNNYLWKDALFICSSPFQIMGAVGILKGLKLNADLCITREFPNYKDIAERIKAHNLFSNVYTADSKLLIGRGKWHTIRLTIFAEKAISTFLPHNIAYKACYMTSRSTLKSTLLAVLRKRNPDTERVVYEDGLGIYSDNSNLFMVSKIRNIMESLLDWDLDRPEKIRIMSYLPELVRVPATLKGHSVEQMPRIEINKENMELFSDIFNYQEDMKIEQRYIIFDTKRRGGELDLLTKEEKTVLDTCYDIANEYAIHDVICKPHPKSNENPSCEVPIYLGQSIPMEVLYMNMSSLENRILISHVSTAVFTPKIFFDSEPVVICLHKILKDSWVSKNFEAIYEKFRSIYRDKERVLAPQTIEEYRTQLSTIRDSVLKQ